MTFGETKQTHPVRGLLWGIPMGIGLAVVLVVAEVISLDLTQIIIVLLLAMVAGALWGIYGPAKRPQGPPPRDIAAQDLSATSDSPDLDDEALDTMGEVEERAINRTPDQDGDGIDSP